MARTIRCRHSSVRDSRQRKGWTEKEDEEARTGTERRGTGGLRTFFFSFLLCPQCLSSSSHSLAAHSNSSHSHYSHAALAHHSFNASSVHSFSQSIIIIGKTDDILSDGAAASCLLLACSLTCSLARLLALLLLLLLTLLCSNKYYYSIYIHTHLTVLDCLPCCVPTIALLLSSRNVSRPTE